ncbi:MAG: NADH dehydrogenase, subunit 5, partial [uncultured Solirubrobacteraceae bacterium]
MTWTSPRLGAAALAGTAVWTLTVAALGGVTLDPLTLVLAAVVLGVAAVVAAFSTRYMQDDPHLGRFLALLGMTTAGTLTLTTAATLGGLLAGWLLAGAGFCLLLAHGRRGAGGGAALRRTVVAFAVGDAALVIAGGLVLATAGNADLAALGPAAREVADAGLAAPVSILLVIAALARCAQLPLHRWLPATVAAPTPVSALLHAGVVNAGGILLIRLGPLGGMTSAAQGLLLAAGAATAVYATAAMLTRADVKGALAHSTMAQMGFMLVQVALGAAAAAVVNLVGHAMYKATLFLGSGSAVD